MSARPAFLTLKLTDPRMGDPLRERAGVERALVRVVQERLRVPETGLYDRPTAAAVQRWQWQQGAPDPTGAIAAPELAHLIGGLDRPPEWAARAIDRQMDGRWLPIRDAIDTSIPEPGAVVRVRMISRSAWRARAPRGRSIVGYRSGTPVVVHWQGPGRGAVGLEACFGQLRGFQRFHMDVHGWSDVGYNLAIPRGVEPGIVIECRGLGVRGAHSGHEIANTYPGVLVMTGEDDPGPDAGQMATILALRDAIDHGRRTGHNEWSGTACPGPVLIPFIDTHR